MAGRQSAYHEESGTLTSGLMTLLLLYFVVPGADSGFDGIRETQGACRGAVGLVKSRKKIVANDDINTPALAA